MGNQHTEITFKTGPLPVDPIPDSSPSGLYNVTMVVIILIVVMALFIFKRNT